MLQHVSQTDPLAGTAIVFTGAQVVLPDQTREVSVRVEGGVITGLDTARDGARVVDASGKILAPAMIDLHGDAFERQLMPRPGVSIAPVPAILETDRQLAVNGIATAYHALTFSWEPGLRSVGSSAAFLAALAATRPRLTVDNRIQLRWETFCFDALPVIEEAALSDPKPSLAFNDHTSMMLCDRSVPIQDRPFEHGPDFRTVDLTDPDFLASMDRQAQRAGLSRADYIARITEVWARRGEVPASIAQVAGMCRAAGVPMLSHDDTQPGTRTFYRDQGAGIAEFPMRTEVAERAKAAGDFVIFGAPNAARGGSHLGSPAAGEMIAAGLCDILVSDYYYPALLSAMARLRADGVLDLPALWSLVSDGPARAMGLADRGRIEVGRRADLLLIDWPEGAHPAVRTTLSGGRVAYQSAPAA